MFTSSREIITRWFVFHKTSNILEERKDKQIYPLVSSSKFFFAGESRSIPQPRSRRKSKKSKPKYLTGKL
jgi:hypothetical protein